MCITNKTNYMFTYTDTGKSISVIIEFIKILIYFYNS